MPDISPPVADFIYKLIPPDDWAQVLATGFVPPGANDEADGFIHLSTADQYIDTANRHYTDHPLVLALKIDCAKLEGALRWEPARKRNNALFPHLYGRIPIAAVCAVHRLIRGGTNNFHDEGPVSMDQLAR